MLNPEPTAWLRMAPESLEADALADTPLDACREILKSGTVQRQRPWRCATPTKSFRHVRC